MAAADNIKVKIEVNASDLVEACIKALVEDGTLVEVVRCKDCRWKEQEQPGMVYCPATVGGWVDEDWFCKGGERSEG